jgi:hypothetical protein
MLELSPFSRRLLLRRLISLMVGHVCFGAYVWWAMHQPPETFARVIVKDVRSRALPDFPV